MIYWHFSGSGSLSSFGNSSRSSMTRSTEANSAVKSVRKNIGSIRLHYAAIRPAHRRPRHNPLNTELGADLHLLPSTASRLSDRLADAGLITRQISPTNRRATLLELTDAGRAVLDELTNLRIEAFGDVVARMTERDRIALVRGTMAFTKAHRAQTAHPVPDRSKAPRRRSSA